MEPNLRTSRVPATPEEVRAAVENAHIKLHLHARGPSEWHTMRPSFRKLMTFNFRTEDRQQWVIDISSCLKEQAMRGDHAVLPFATAEQLFEARYPGGLDQFAEENDLVRLHHPYSDYAFTKTARYSDVPPDGYRLSYSKDQTDSKRVRHWFYPKSVRWYGGLLAKVGYRVNLFNTEEQKSENLSPMALSDILLDLPAGPQHDLGEIFYDLHWQRQDAMGKTPAHPPFHIPQEQPATS